jgi:acyl-CoA thioester hydrolase
VPPLWSSPVRYVECDQQGIVFNAHYLVWADEAANAWWVDRGVRWEELTPRGLEYLVVASTLDWRSSARWGDTVEVDAALDTLGRTSLAVRFDIRVGERVCCRIRTTYVCTRDGASAPWPDEIRALVAGD